MCPTGIPPPITALRADIRHYLHHSLALPPVHSTTWPLTASPRLHLPITTSPPMAPSYQCLRKRSCSMLHTSQAHSNQSIKVYLFAIRNLHLEQGLANPLEDATHLCSLLRGIKCHHGCTTDSRLPVTPTILNSFRTFLNLFYPDHLTLWAAMVVAFFGFLPSNELLALTHEDVVRTNEGYLIKIRRSKTDPFHMGATTSLAPSGNGTLCPVTVLNHFRFAA